MTKPYTGTLLERVQMRLVNCTFDVDECWHCTPGNSEIPVVHLGVDNEEIVNVLYALATGCELPAEGEREAYTMICGDFKCVNPAHVEIFADPDVLGELVELLLDRD